MCHGLRRENVIRPVSHNAVTGHEILFKSLLLTSLYTLLPSDSSPLSCSFCSSPLSSLIQSFIFLFLSSFSCTSSRYILLKNLFWSSAPFSLLVSLLWPSFVFPHVFPSQIWRLAVKLGRFLDQHVCHFLQPGPFLVP